MRIDQRPELKGAILLKATPQYDKKSGDYIIEGQVRIFDRRPGENWYDLIPSWSKIKTDKKSKKILIEVAYTYGTAGTAYANLMEK